MKLIFFFIKDILTLLSLSVVDGTMEGEEETNVLGIPPGMETVGVVMVVVPVIDVVMIGTDIAFDGFVRQLVVWELRVSTVLVGIPGVIVGGVVVLGIKIGFLSLFIERRNKFSCKV